MRNTKAKLLRRIASEVSHPRMGHQAKDQKTGVITWEKRSFMYEYKKLKKAYKNGQSY